MSPVVRVQEGKIPLFLCPYKGTILLSRIPNNIPLPQLDVVNAPLSSDPQGVFLFISVMRFDYLL